MTLNIDKLFLEMSFKVCAWISLSLVIIKLTPPSCHILFNLQLWLRYTPTHSTHTPTYPPPHHTQVKGTVIYSQTGSHQHLPNWINCGSLFTPGPAPVLAATSTLYRIPGTREGMTTEKVEPSTVLFIW